jgi:hypothetical protein
LTSYNSQLGPLAQACLAANNTLKTKQTELNSFQSLVDDGTVERDGAAAALDEYLVGIEGALKVKSQVIGDWLVNGASILSTLNTSKTTATTRVSTLAGQVTALKESYKQKLTNCINDRIKRSYTDAKLPAPAVEFLPVPTRTEILLCVTEVGQTLTDEYVNEQRLTVSAQLEARQAELLNKRKEVAKLIHVIAAINSVRASSAAGIVVVFDGRVTAIRQAKSTGESKRSTNQSLVTSKKSEVDSAIDAQAQVDLRDGSRATCKRTRAKTIPAACNI